MIRRRGVALALGLTMALVAGACSGSSAPSESGGTGGPDTQPPSNGCELATPSTTDVAAAPIQVTVWEPYQGRMQTALERVVARYNSVQPRVKVVLDSALTGDAEQARFDAAAATPATTANLPTIVVLDGGRTQAVADSKVIVPASTCTKNPEDDPTSPLPSVRAAYTVDEVHWGGATTLDTPMLYLNRAHLTRAGLDPEHPPRTLKELADVAAKLKQAGVSSKPLALPLDPVLIENWLTGAGANVVNHENGRDALASASAFDNPRTLELYQWLHDLAAAGLVDAVPPTAPAGTALADLVTQTSSMVIAPASAIGVVDAFVEGRGDTAALGLTPGTTLPSSSVTDLDVAPLPGLDGPGRGQVAGDAWYVTTASSPDQRAAAWDFLRYLGDVDNQVKLNLEASVPPSNTKAVDDPALQAVWGKTRRGHWLDTAYTQVTNFDTQAPGPLIGPSTPVRAAIAVSLESVITGPATPADAITAADKAIDEAVKAYAKAHPPS
jgi:sn-glycerol 3-phosphate transport system substrate-binding protein